MAFLPAVLIVICISKVIDVNNIDNFVFFIQDYLIKYGYLSYPDHKIGKVISMEELRAAVRKMQRFAGLEETGDISDPKALALVKRIRCGVPDVGPSDNARRKRRYALQGSHWRKTVSNVRL